MAMMLVVLLVMLICSSSALAHDLPPRFVPKSMSLI